MEATQIASPRAKRLSGATPLGSESSALAAQTGTRYTTIVSSPEEALLAEEIQRTRSFAHMSVLLTGVGLIALPFLPVGLESLRWVVFAGTAICFLQSVWFALSLRNPENFNLARVVVLALTATFTAYLAVLFWGVFSAAPSLIVIGLYFFGRSVYRRSAYLVLILFIGLQATFASLIASGTMRDPGLFPIGDQPPEIIAFTQAILLGLFGMAFWLARQARQSTLGAIDGLLAARRQVSQKEAQFEEVKRELDRALVIGGAGRYTDQILGGYKLGPVIGRGGMGEVYEASNVSSGEIAAIKLLHANLLSNVDSVRRFIREAQAAGAIQSPHAVAILGASGPDDPVPFLIMERLHGHDLGYYLRKSSRLDPVQLVDMLRQVSQVIDAASVRGVVHRDLKPQNLFYAADPRSETRLWKVLDFGASKLGHHSGTLTEGRVIGTPGYLSPEQACGEDVDGGADRYGLAAIAYRCITGRIPFSGKELPAILYKVVHGMPPQPTSLAAVPPPVDAVLAIGLAKRSADRFETAAEFTESLATALAGHRDDWLERRAEALLAEVPWGYNPRR